MGYYHHIGDIMSISFSPENAFSITWLMFEVKNPDH